LRVESQRVRKAESRKEKAEMDGLLPIIRRVRRPLVPVGGTAGGTDAAPASVPVAAAVAPVAPVEVGVAESAGSQKARRKRGPGAAASQ
jgi:hypothetical protein